MQEYYSKYHSHPLIVLPMMKLYYFKNDTSIGFYVVTSVQYQRRYDSMHLLIQEIQQQQGNFQILSKANHGMTFRTIDQCGNTVHFLTAWNFRWKDCMKVILKLQRFRISKKLKRIGLKQDVFKIKPMIEFLKTECLPMDIMNSIVDIYFKH